MSRVFCIFLKKIFQCGLHDARERHFAALGKHIFGAKSLELRVGVRSDADESPISFHSFLLFDKDKQING